MELIIVKLENKINKPLKTFFFYGVNKAVGTKCDCLSSLEKRGGGGGKGVFPQQKCQVHEVEELKFPGRPDINLVRGKY